MKTVDATRAICQMRVTGMDCADCAKTVEQSLRTLPGVAETTVNFVRGTADVTYDPARADRETFTRRITALGYGVETQTVASPDHEATWTFDVTGMDCGDCAKTVQAGVARVPGVQEARVNFAVGTLIVTAIPTETTPETISQTVAEAGYGAALRGVPVAPAATSGWWRQRRVRELVLAALLWLIGFTVERAGMPRLASAVPFIAGMLIGGYPVARAGWFALRARRADMNLLMTVAAVGAVAIGQWDEGASVLILFGIGTLLQAMTVERTRRAIAGLLAIAPAEANVLHDDHEHRVPVAQVNVGDVVRVRPGERLPVDGVVVAGQSAVDQAPITGESVPVEVQTGVGVFAGSVNGEGTIAVRATKPARDTTLARIVALVEEAQASKAPAQAFVDRFAAIYTPLVILGALLVAVVPPLIVGGWSGWIYKALVLLVVACPCALVISTPVALMAAIGAASRRGVLFKGGAALEALAAVRAVALDKTGTLTVGRPTVVAVHTCDDAAEHDVLRIAAALERQSEHPLARAVVVYGRERDVLTAAVADYRAAPGRGGNGAVDGVPASVGSMRWFTERGLWHQAGHEAYLSEGNAVVCVERAGRMIGLLTLRDAVRPESARAVADLRSLVERVVMLTGDNARTAGLIATATGVTDVYADLLPADKAAAVRALAVDGPVAMVGDGINDAPALATASVGVAMGTAGTDVAIEAADVALMGDDLGRLPDAIRLARRTLGIIRQNIAVSLIVKAVFLILTFAGVTNLWLAVFADMGISLLVTANALRVLRMPEKADINGA
ncbi:MAG: cadmium-translocating P-type ATPase [Chloroflexota bacterium]|nr:cadmium-translocating P-type ATPase [Chloroflexota bacterium]